MMRIPIGTLYAMYEESDLLRMANGLQTDHEGEQSRTRFLVMPAPIRDRKVVTSNIT